MHIRKRNGKWQALVTIGKDAKGRRRTRSVTAASKSEVRRLAAKLEIEARPDGNTTFSDVLDRFLGVCEARGLANQTIYQYGHYARKFLKPALGSRPVEKITPADLDALYAAMLEDGYVPSSVRKCHVTAGGALKQAVRWGMTSANPARAACPPRQQTVQPTDIPTPEEVARILEACAPDLRIVVRFLAATGCRPGEACAVRWCDLDLEGGVVTISGSIDSRFGVRERKDTKTHRVRRIILDPATVSALKDWRAERPVVRLDGEDYVFGDVGRGMRSDGLAARFKKVARKTGVEATPKSLRHFHATQLLASGKLSVKQVAERLGHANPTVTLTVYAHAIPALDHVAADVMGEVLDGSVTGTG